MAIITLARQVGSGGQSIANALASRLGYRLFGRHELRQAAQASGLPIPESFEAFANEDLLAAGSLIHRSSLYVSYGELEFDAALRGHSPDLPPTDPPSFLDALTRHHRDILLGLQSVVYRLAAEDRLVLVGAGSQLLLAKISGVVRVKVVAPEDVRTERLATAYHLTLAEAQAAVWRGDQEQRAYNRVILGADWDDPLSWDLVANTERLTVDDVSELVATLVERPAIAHGLGESEKASLAAAAAINHALWADVALRRASIIAVPTGAGIVLRGESATDAERDSARSVADTVAPTIPIRDEVRPANGTTAS